QLIASSIDRYQLEKRFLRKDGSLVWGLVNVFLLRSDSDRPVVVGMVEDIDEKKTIESKLLSSEAQLQKLAEGLIQAQDEERRRISRELHDDIGQRLSLLAAEIDSLWREQESVGSQGRGPQLAEMQRTAAELANDIQQLSHELHSSKLQYL